MLYVFFCIVITRYDKSYHRSIAIGYFQKEMRDPIQSDIINGPERHAFQLTGRACSITSRTLFSAADRAASLVRDEEMLAAREIRVRSSVKRDTDWTVNISLRWHGTWLSRLGVSRLAREGLERWVYVFISRLRGSLSRDV